MPIDSVLTVKERSHVLVLLQHIIHELADVVIVTLVTCKSSLLMLFKLSLLLSRGFHTESPLFTLNQMQQAIKLLSAGLTLATVSLSRLILIKVLQKLGNSKFQCAECTVFDLIKPLFIDHVLVVVRPLDHSIRAIVHMTVPVDVV